LWLLDLLQWVQKWYQYFFIFIILLFFVIIYLDRISNASIKVESPESWEYNKKGFIFLFSLFVKFSLEISRTVIGTIS